MILLGTSNSLYKPSSLNEGQPAYGESRSESEGECTRHSQTICLVKTEIIYSVQIYRYRMVGELSPDNPDRIVRIHRANWCMKPGMFATP